MKLADCSICWTPNLPQYPSGMRGKMRVFPAGTAPDHLAPFPRRAGLCDAQASDTRPEVRQTHALRVAFVASERDGLDAAHVHEQMLQVDEYRVVAPDLVPEGAT